jgi:ATP-dependent RNA helicase DeaD
VNSEFPELDADTATSESSAAGFAELGLDDKILRALRDLGYETPSPIQAKTIPALLEGRHVVGTAQTGTGKTAAFALPILDQLDLRAKAPQALVLAPTRELAVQVCEAFQSYAARMTGVHVLPVYGGQGYGVQLSALARGVHVVVGTPGRIMDHLENGTLDLTQLRFLVLDEADEMLSMGFAEDVETILADTPDDKQVALFSATMPPAIRRLSQRYLTDPVEVSVKGKTATAANVRHRYLQVSYPSKVDALTRILEVENFDGLIVFVRTKNDTETVAEKLAARGYSAAAINGDIAQSQRERVINQLKSGKLDILVATDVAARGLDVDRITHVVNLDLPLDTESYVHRVGRTGRAGRSGEAISFVTPRERRLLATIERVTKQALSPMTLPSAEDINASRLSRFDDQITEALASDRLEFFREVVAHDVDEYDVPEVDVAAALAVTLQGAEPMLLEPDAPARPERDRGQWSDRELREPREPRGERPSRGGQGLVTYRISVGKRHKIGPRQIVGALANEGGLRREDFGHIDIRMDHSLIELPALLSEDCWEALKSTRISGKLIELSRDNGAPRRGERSQRDYGSRGDRPYRGGNDRGDRGDRGPRGDKPRSKDRW